MVDAKNTFSGWDYVVFVGVLAISMGIGVFFAFKGGRQKTQGEYLMANRNMSVIPVAISILVSFMSAILILGTPAEMYTQGTEFYLLWFGMGIGIVLAAVLFVPLLYPLRITSAFEYLEKRFNSRAVRLVGTSLMILTQVLYMGIASFAPSTALAAVTGFPVWATILTIGVVATFYTSIGGMKAVVWTDVFQSIVMFAGILAIAIQGTVRVGGVTEVWKTADLWGRIQFFNFDPDPTVRHTVWGLVIGGALQWMGNIGVNQASVQRYLCLPTLTKAKRSVLLTLIGSFLLLTITCYTGVVLFAYYTQRNCNPLGLKLVDNPNQLIPYFVMEILGYPGVPGLFISCLFSGALSSVSSSLNALAAITWEDIMKPHLDSKLSESTKTLVTKLLVLGFGLAAVGVSFIAQTLEGTVLQAAVSLTGAGAGPLTGMFILGAFFPWANSKGVIVGAVTALFTSLWLSIGSYASGIPQKSFPYPNGTTCDVLPHDGAYSFSSSATPYLTSTMMYSATAVVTTAVTLPTPDQQVRSVLQTIYSISYLWYTPLSILITVLVGLAVSFITGANSLHDIPTKYQIPFFARLFPCLPKSLDCKRRFDDPEDIYSDENDIEMVVQDSQGKQNDGLDNKSDINGGLDNELFNYDQLDSNKMKTTNGEMPKSKREETQPRYRSLNQPDTDTEQVSGAITTLPHPPHYSSPIQPNTDVEQVPGDSNDSHRL